MGLAYLVSEFPSLTITFIYREVFEIQRRGIRVKLYSLRKPELSSLSKESIELYRSTNYLLPIDWHEVAYSHLKAFGKNPIKYFITLSKMVITTSSLSIKKRYRSLMHFGEGVVLAERMIRDGVTHIHAHFASQPTSVARVVHLLKGIPFSFSAHAHDIWWDKLLLREKIDEAVFVSCCSEFGRCQLIKEGSPDSARKIHLVYHGLNIGKFAMQESCKARERNLILSIGRLTAQKGFSDLIEACKILQEKNFDFHCVIIGEGEQREELERQIEISRIKGKVELLGALPHERAREYYRSAWVFALPCVDTKDGNRDGIPNVLMEAMATGLPVITTTNSGQSELIENGRHGILIPPNSPVELADSIMMLSKETQLRERISIEARRRIVRDFDNRKTITPLLELLEGSVKGMGPRI